MFAVMEQELRGHLAAVAQTFASGSGLELVTVARYAAGDWRFFDRLAEGAGFTARKYDDVMQWFSDHWPENHPWPDDVPRPIPAPAPEPAP